MEVTIYKSITLLHNVFKFSLEVQIKCVVKLQCIPPPPYSWLGNMKVSIVLFRRKRCGTHRCQAVGSRHWSCQYDNTVHRGQVTTYVLVSKCDARNSNLSWTVTNISEGTETTNAFYNTYRFSLCTRNTSRFCNQVGLCTSLHRVNACLAVTYIHNPKQEESIQKQSGSILLGLVCCSNISELWCAAGYRWHIC